MSDIFHAKQRVPLPALMQRLGLGEHAKKSAPCPFHDDQHSSYSTWRNKDGLWSWKCHAGCGQGDEITFLEKHHGISNKEATKLFLEMAGVKGKNEQTFNWPSYVDACTDKHVEQIAKWRGYSVEFVKQLRDKGQIGIYEGLVAFPVHNDGKIAGTHVRKKDGKWFYAPEGIKAAPLVFGALIPGKPIHVFESTWDGLDYMDKTGERDGVIIARGAGNAKFGAALIPQGSTAFLWTQNDEPGAKWERDFVANAKCAIKRVKFPAHDLNAWTLRTGATGKELRTAVINAEVMCEKPRPPSQGSQSQDFSNHNVNDGDSSDAHQQGRKSAATQLVELANTFDFFHDPQDRPFVRLEINGHAEVWPVESTKFRKLLARMYYQRTRNAINRNALADAITTLAGRACHDSPEEPVFLRVAPHGKNILIDLCDEPWRVVEVTPEGWQVLDRSPVAFIRTGSMQALPEPVSGGSIDPLWDLLNVTEEQRPLVEGALLNAYHPHGPYFVTNYVGEHGTAKTCAARIHRQLVDPNANPLRSPPKEERDLIAQAASNRCVALDNLSSLPPWLSDALCRLATGGGHSARTLYTDLEEISLAVKRPVILNGIEDVARRPDLADRVLQIELDTIPNEKRISEEYLCQEFDEQRPVIFSGLLEALVCALRELPSITLDSLPRMADAALWATAGETAFGSKRGTFMAAYTKHLNEGAIVAVEAHPVGVAIRQLLEEQTNWSGEPTQLLQTLNGLVTEEQRHAKAWPKNVLSLGHILRRLAPALRRTGIGYERDRSTRRTIQMSMVGKKPSGSSEPSENPAEKDNPDDPDGFDDFSATLHVSTCSQQTAATTHPDPKPVLPTASPIVGDEFGVGRL